MNNKTAIITGASRGIGAAIAGALAKDGIAVAINYLQDSASAEKLVADIVGAGGKAIAIQANVADRKSIDSLFDQAERAFGGVDIVVNNAGLAVRKPFGELSEDEFDAIVATNLKSVFLTTSAAAKTMRSGGRIVNISASFQGAPIVGYGPYAATKMAVEKMTEVAARELGGRGITVNSVRPGPTKTALFLNGKSPELQEAFAKQIALGRLGEPEDIANIVRFLVSEQASWVTGQNIGANGGYW